MVRIAFHGADQNVTGSCHLIEAGGRRILVDCGLYQGTRELSQENSQPFGFDPATVDFLLLTHAHLDHCGRIPLLVKRGFKGEIIATAATFELMRVVLLDAAHLQEEDAQRWARHRQRSGGGDPAPPLYTMLDALNCFRFCGREAVCGLPIELSAELHATFLDAAHILGSASIYLQIGAGTSSRSVLFSGDLGNAGRPLLANLGTPPHADAVVMETTYGDRLHRPLQSSIEELYEVVDQTYRRGGNVVIPSFALERAQEILYFLRVGIESGRLPRLMAVFLDSPMAIAATAIFERHPECYGPELARLFSAGVDPFQLPNLRFTRETEESIAINRISGGAVIVAGSGMCTGGRIRHHLRHNLWRDQCSIVFVGYAARGTLARAIIDGAENVRIFDEPVRVRASVHTINGFSAHADRDELLAWHRQTRAEVTFLVHGEADVMHRFAAELHGTRVVMPALHESFEL